MKTKSWGKCFACEKRLFSSEGILHLHECLELFTLSYKKKELCPGYLIKVSSKNLPETYWMYIAIPASFTLKKLDTFIREKWFESGSSLGLFTIADLDIIFHDDLRINSLHQLKPLNQILSPGLKFSYSYDDYLATTLSLQVIESIENVPDSRVLLLMQNDAPYFSCMSCKKEALLACPFCKEKLCNLCSKSHPCRVLNKTGNFIRPLSNSPHVGFPTLESSSAKEFVPA
jgi:hypothetical protein